jgi:hypothetical protein
MRVELQDIEYFICSRELCIAAVWRQTAELESGKHKRCKSFTTLSSIPQRKGKVVYAIFQAIMKWFLTQKKWENVPMNPFDAFMAHYHHKCDVCCTNTEVYSICTDDRFYHFCESCLEGMNQLYTEQLQLQMMKKLYSKGCRWGYKLATTRGFAVATMCFLNEVLEDARNNNQQVFMLGRDMDLFYLLYSRHSHVHYFAGWNRGFNNYGSTEQKLEVLNKNNVKPFDAFIDTGFVGSILTGINTIRSIEGYLLSSDNGRWNTFSTNHNIHGYRLWINNLEDIPRVRKVVDGQEVDAELGNMRLVQGVYDGWVSGIADQIGDAM